MSLFTFGLHDDVSIFVADLEGLGSNDKNRVLSDTSKHQPQRTLGNTAHLPIVVEDEHLSL